MFSEKSTWKGPYTLNAHLVDKLVLNDGPGMYALGEMTKDQKFVMKYIGSCANLKARLKGYLGKYHTFMFDLYEPEEGVFTDRHVLADYRIKVNSPHTFFREDKNREKIINSTINKLQDKDFGKKVRGKISDRD